MNWLLEKQDRKAIKINNKQDANIKTNYKRDTDITWFTQYGIHQHRNWKSFIIIPSNKIKGYNLQQPRCTSSSPSHGLSHTIIEIFFTMIQYITIQYATHLYYNSFHLQGNYHGKIPWVTQYHGSVNRWSTNIPKKLSWGTSVQ